MHIINLTAAAAGILTLGVIGADAGRRAHPTSMPDQPDVATTVVAPAGACKASIDFKNSGRTRLGLVQPSSQVKVRYGLWRKVWAGSNLQVTVYVEPGQTKNLKASLDLGCNAARRYRFRVQNPSLGRAEYLYHPSSRSWTKDNTRFTIDLAKAPF